MERFEVNEDNKPQIIQAISELAQFLAAKPETQQQVISLDNLGLTKFLLNFSGKRPLEEILAR